MTDLTANKGGEVKLSSLKGKYPILPGVCGMQIEPSSFSFTLLLGFLAAVPYSGTDINLPAMAATGATLGRELL